MGTIVVHGLLKMLLSLAGTHYHLLRETGYFINYSS